MIIKRALIILSFAVCVSSLQAAGDGSTLHELKQKGTDFLLRGDYAAALVIEHRLLEEFDEPVGQTFALNTMVTHLAWDETSTDFDVALPENARQTLNWCKPRLKKDPKDELANFYCGQAHFALAYFEALHGNYYQAGRHGTLCIELLEAALETNHGLVDAKMHLGAAYFFADHLPPFVRMFSKFLWFIPSGNSEKSLPYLLEVVNHGDIYPDVARYIYSYLLLSGAADDRERAERELMVLVQSYPFNARFQLRLISILLQEGKFQDSFDTAQRYITAAAPPTEPELSLAKIWQVRALMELGRHGQATRLFQDISPLVKPAGENLPDWSVYWHMLTEAQLDDVTNQREQAISGYRQILDNADALQVSDLVRQAAENGLRVRYQPGDQSAQ